MTGDVLAYGCSAGLLCFVLATAIITLALYSQRRRKL